MCYRLYDILLNIDNIFLYTYKEIGGGAPDNLQYVIMNGCDCPHCVP